MIWQIIFCLFLFHQSNAMFKNSANIKNFIPPPGAHPHEVIGVPDAVQYKFTNERSFWELNEKDEQLGHVDSLGNVDVFNVKSGQFERIEGEGKPPEPVIIQESLFAGQKTTAGASKFAKQTSQGVSASIFDNGNFGTQQKFRRAESFVDTSIALPPCSAKVSGSKFNVVQTPGKSLFANNEAFTKESKKSLISDKKYTNPGTSIFVNMGANVAEGYKKYGKMAIDSTAPIIAHGVPMVATAIPVVANAVSTGVSKAVDFSTHPKTIEGAKNAVSMFKDSVKAGASLTKDFVTNPQTIETTKRTASFIGKNIIVPTGKFAASAILNGTKSLEDKMNDRKY